MRKFGNLLSSDLHNIAMSEASRRNMLISFYLCENLSLYGFYSLEINLVLENLDKSMLLLPENYLSLLVSVIILK